MDVSHVESDLKATLVTEEQIQQRLRELAAEIDADYEGRDLLLVGVLKGAVMVMADLARSLERHVAMDWMAISSYGSGTSVVRRGPHPQGPRHRHHRPARAGRRGHHRHRAHALLAGRPTWSLAARGPSRSAPCSASPTHCG